jgi:hypothetical protein
VGDSRRLRTREVGGQMKKEQSSNFGLRSKRSFVWGREEKKRKNKRRDIGRR